MGTHSSTAAREEVNPKAGARREVLRHMAHLDPDWVARASEAVQRRVLALPAWGAARAVSAYLSLPREVQTAGLIAAAHAAGQRVCVPAWDAAQGAYAFAWLTPGAPLKPGRMGIGEPVSVSWAAPAELDLLLAPLVAFDPYGRRLGHGRGYYDRLLSRCRGLKVGVAFEAQRLAAVPVEAHDVGLDLVLTEAGAYGPKKEQP